MIDADGVKGRRAKFWNIAETPSPSRSEPRGRWSVSIFDVLNATDYVVPAIEIIDARIRRVDLETGRTRAVLDTISDNAANASA